jgi:hypothetical protein
MTRAKTKTKTTKKRVLPRGVCLTRRTRGTTEQTEQTEQTKKRKGTIGGAVVVNDDDDDDDDGAKRRRRRRAGGRMTIVPSMTSSPNARRRRRRQRSGRDEDIENDNHNHVEEAFLVESEKENAQGGRQSEERVDRGGGGGGGEGGGGATLSTTTRTFEWVDDGARRAYEMYLSYYRAATAFSRSTGDASETFARMVAAAAAARRVPAMYGDNGDGGFFGGLSLYGSSGVPADGGEEDEDAARAKRWPVVPQVSTAVCPPRSESVRATPPGFFTTKRQAVNAGVQAGSAAKTMAKQMMREAPTRAGVGEEEEASRSSRDKGAIRAKRVEEAKALLDPSNALDRSALERDTKATRNEASRRRRSERSNAPSPESSLAVSIEGVLGGRKSAAPSA